MPKLTITRGVSGSGKSTWADAQPNTIKVSRDDLRAALFGSDGQDYYSVPKDVLRSREDYITKVEHEAVARALRAGFNVVSDNTNIQMKFVKPIASLGYKVGADVEIKVFDVPLHTALERNALRASMGGREVPVDVIRKQHESLQGSKNHTLQAPEPLRPYTGTPGKPKAFLVDIDGTLAHMRDYRGPFEWHNVGLDDVDEVIADIVNGVRAGFYDDGNVLTTIVMSGRDEVCRQQTEDWLSDWVEYDHLFMRPEKDMRPDNIVKAELFDKYIRDNFDVQFVLDDRNQVVDMWRSMGVKCLQVAEGDF